MKKTKRSFVHRLFRRKNRSNRPLAEELQDISLFSGLKRRELINLEQIIYLRSYKKGEAIFREGTPGYAFFILRHGKVSLSRECGNGETRFAGQLSPGEVLGELVILCSANRNFSAVAEEDSELAVLFRHDFMEFIESYHKTGVTVLLAMTALIGERYLDLMDTLDPDTDPVRGGDHAISG